MSSSQSIAVSVPNPVSTGPTEQPGTTRASTASDSSQSTTSQQQHEQQQRKAQQSSGLKQVKLTTMKRPPGIDPMAIMKERETRSVSSQIPL